jgi:hypothetical protein
MEQIGSEEGETMKVSGMRRAAMAAAISLTVAGVAAAGLPAAQAAPARIRNVVVSCTGRALVRPVTYDIACAHGNEHMAHMSWTSWGTKAHGSGRDEIKVMGTFRGYRALAKLWRLRPRPHHPRQRYYTRMKLTYTHAVPPGFHRTRTIILRNHA